MFRIIKKILKWLLWTVLGIALVLALVYWNVLLYGIRQANGQFHIIWNARPVSYYLEDPTYPDSLKRKLRLVEEVRQYAIDSLGLKDTKNYKTLYDQQGKEVMWVVTACRPFELVEKEWNFPVLGAVPYKGFFNEALAREEQRALELDGWDVSVRNPGGWSTLGWFTDPIMSGMLSRSDGDLASLIIHEMVHATVFVKDSVEYNENLASFIGDRGAEMFLISKYGEGSAMHRAFVKEDMDYKRYVDHMLRACDYLDSVYAGIQREPEEVKLLMKEKAIRQIMQAVDTLTLVTMPRPANRLVNQLPNNAYFIGFRRYQSRQEDFEREMQQHGNGNLKAYLRWLEQRYPFL